MVFGLNLSISTSATFVSTSSVNGEARGWAYQRQSYRNNDGSGVRTRTQTLGGPPVTNTRMYDSQGREFLTQGGYEDNNYNNNNTYYNNNNVGSGSSRRNHDGSVSQRRREKAAQAPYSRIISIEDVTEEENAKAAKAAEAQKNNTEGQN